MQQAHIIQSALGWFDLGNYVEAWNELENLPPKDRASIEVMELRCRIYRKLEKWRELQMLSEGCYASSGHVEFLNYHAWALLKQSRGEDAKALLERHNDHLTKKDAEYCFTFACVLSSLGDKGAAKWLQTAFDLSHNPATLKLRALEQPELERIWRHESDGRR